MGNINKLILVGVLAILSINIAVALGVNSPYWNENPLKMYPGESREVSFVLVNGVNEPATQATVSLINGSEIAGLTSKTSYTLQPGENNQNINLKIEVPQSAQLGSSYEVGFVVRYTPEGEEGNVKLDVEYNVNFPVEVVSREGADSTIRPEETGGESNRTSIWIILAILVVIIIIVLFIVLRFNRNQNRQMNKIK